MQNFSLHTHTIGFDGKNTVEEMVRAAQNIGFKKLGISNHFIVHPNIKDSKMYAYSLRGGYHNIYNATFDEAIEKFIELTGTSDYKHWKIPAPQFMAITYGKFPLYVFIENGKVVKAGDFRVLDDGLLMEFF